MKKVFDKASLAAAVDQNRDGYIPGDQYEVGQFRKQRIFGISRPEIMQACSKKSKCKKNSPPIFKAKETVAAGYLRFDQKLARSGI